MNFLPNGFPPETWPTSDVKITQTLEQLRVAHYSAQSQQLEANDLIQILDDLFYRKTFRYESRMELCVTRNWESRLHSALKTKRILQIYVPNIAKKGSIVQQQIYSDLLRWLDEYVECMTGFLFQKKINYAQIDLLVGTNDFEPFMLQCTPLENLQNLTQDQLARLDNGLGQTIACADLLKSSVMQNPPLP